MEVSEGGVTVDVPALATNGTKDGVFYNPRQELNRDVTIAALRAFAERDSHANTYFDAMTATGIRAVRAAADGWSVIAGDHDPEAVALARKNLDANDLEAEVERANANVLLHQSDYDIVDIDPFGSPVGYLDAVFARPRRLVCITATDTAPLCGAHFRAGIRRYGAIPRNTEYHAEVGLRVLLSTLCRTAARYDLAITPILSHAEGHYVRTYLTLERGAQVADDAIDRLGTLWHCQDCLHRETAKGLLTIERETCPACQSNRFVTAGPLWLGPTHDATFVDAVRTHLDDSMNEAARADRMLETIGNELDRPTHYDQHVLCKQWNRSAPAMETFLAELEAADYRTSRAHYAGTAFKTDASVATMRTVTGE